MKKGVGVFLLIAAPFLAGPAEAATIGWNEADRCEVSDDLLRLGAPLPRTVERLKNRLPLTVVALGSSSTYGTGASGPDRTYPRRLELVLQERFPGSAPRVINRGVGGETEVAMVERIDRDVLAEKPDLVIWQVGANAVLRGDPTRADGALMHEGIERIRASGADIMLMDLQYAPALMLRPRHRDMQHVIAHLARVDDVALFRRFAIMRYWTEEAGVPMRKILAKDHLHLNDRSYGCLGGLVAESIVQAMDEP